MTDPSARGNGAPAETPQAASALLVEARSAWPAGTRLGFSNYLCLAGALAAMIALFSLLSPHFLTYETFSTIVNPIPDLVVISAGMTFVPIIAGIDLSVGSAAGHRGRRDRRHEPHGRPRLGDQHILRGTNHFGAGRWACADRRERADKKDHHGRSDRGRGGARHLPQPAQARLRGRTGPARGKRGGDQGERNN
jgi:hypothetical protein